MRVYHKPLVLLIWLGALVMFIGGALSLSDRRLRIGAPKPATSGSVEPSRADELITQTLKAALALVDVRVLDHVIVAPGQALSLAERGLM